MHVGQPLVSVCIPVYNGERFVADSIRSVLSQTYDHFELVVIDNQSTDHTVDVVNQFRDSRLRLIVNESNIGGAANFNKCLVEARGKYVKLLFADDLIYPQCLEKQVAVLETPGHERVVMTCCRRDIFVDSGRVLMKRGFPRARGVVRGCCAIRKTLRSGGNLIGEPGAVLLRASVLEEVEGFSAARNFVIDLDFWCRILFKGDIFISGETLCAYRVQKNSWSVGTTGSQFSDFHRYLHDFRRQRVCAFGYGDYVTGSLMALLSKYARAVIYGVFMR